MGIKNLKIILDRFAKNSVVMRHLSYYTNKKLAIDTSIFLYKYMYNFSSCYTGFIQQLVKLRRFGIIPVYIFDGKPPKEKNEAIRQRREKKEQYQNRKNEIENIIEKKRKKIKQKENKVAEENEQRNELNKEDNNNVNNNNVNDNNVNDNNENENDNNEEDNNKTIDELNHEIFELEDEHGKVKKKIIYVTNEIVNNLQEIMRAMGVSYYVANGEADVLCCELMKRGIVDGCISEDSDILVNGGKCLIKKFNLMNDYVCEYSLELILEQLNFTYDQFIDLCILCGSDYNVKIPGVGGITAYRQIKDYGNIEGLVSNGKYDIPEDFDYQQVRNLYKESNMNINEEEFQVNFIKSSNYALWQRVLEKNNITLDYSIERLVGSIFFADIVKKLAKVGENGSNVKNSSNKKPKQSIINLFEQLQEQEKKE